MSGQMGESAVKACCDVDHKAHDEFEEKTATWDKWGIFFSTLCAIHCLLTPLLVLTLPVLGEAFENPWVHFGLALFVVPVGLFAFWSGYKHHKKAALLALGILGVFLVGGASLAPHSLIDSLGGELLIIFGSCLLILAHFLNRRACLCHRH
ncbi:MerC mercury resistance protein [compost metagenome]